MGFEVICNSSCILNVNKLRRSYLRHSVFIGIISGTT